MIKWHTKAGRLVESYFLCTCIIYTLYNFKNLTQFETIKLQFYANLTLNYCHQLSFITKDE